MAQWFAYLLPDPAGPGLIPSFPDIFSEEKIGSAAKVNQQRCFEESGQWLENVDQTHLELSGKLVVLQKRCQRLVGDIY